MYPAAMADNFCRQGRRAPAKQRSLGKIETAFSVCYIQYEVSSFLRAFRVLCAMEDCKVLSNLTKCPL